jgi:nicotinamidase/pyrazinamidase
MRKALLIIDMLNDFIDTEGALYIGETGRAIVPVVRRLLDQFRAEGAPVIYICDRHRPDDAEFQMFPPHCIEASQGAEVIKELEPTAGEAIIPKRRYSGFFGTDLDTTLRELGGEELVLVGCCTNICVLYTAAEARMRNYKVTVPRDAVASFDQDAHRWALAEMEKTLGARLS